MRKDTTFSIRISKEELELIKQNAKKARMSQSDYVTHCCLGRQIVVIEGLKELAKELRAIGNNLNQISTKINVGAFQSYNFQEVIDQQKLIYEELYRIGRGGVTWQP